MGATDAVKDLVKPPFANYDIVVYFGCGLFSLPLAIHYIIEPMHLRFPKFKFGIENPIAESLISTLSLLFTVYILGHIIAYVSSLFIEKTIETFFGKVSSAIIIAAKSTNTNKSEMVNAWIYSRCKNALHSGQRFQNIIRIIFHIPALPVYFLVFVTSGFSYYSSRIPQSILENVRDKCKSSEYGSVALYSPWYKSVEYDVINNRPSATARMYNYLIISGIFRSLSLLFLLSLWCEIIYACYNGPTGKIVVKAIMYDGSSSTAKMITICTIATVYGFCVSSYMKFQRRYAEEAIFAFALCRP